MEIKEIANQIMHLWRMDGYHDKITPSYYNEKRHTRTQLHLIVNVGEHMETIEMFRKQSALSLWAYPVRPTHMIVNEIDGILVVIHQGTVYGIKNGQICFTEEVTE